MGELSLALHFVSVIPAKAGIQKTVHKGARTAWIPAFAGMTQKSGRRFAFAFHVERGRFDRPKT
ncbi:hypothetical protein [Azospirillum sp. sgz302134]